VDQGLISVLFFLHISDVNGFGCNLVFILFCRFGAFLGRLRSTLTNEAEVFDEADNLVGTVDLGKAIVCF